MFTESAKVQRSLEIILILTIVGLSCVLFETDGYKMIVLNLFYLPVVLAAFFLGRYRAGVLALLSVILASTIAALDLSNFAAFSSPTVIALALTVWGAVLGLVALLAGTLSDERTAKMEELHEAHIGVVEVLSQYLKSANPKLQDRSNRVAELSRRVAVQLKLSDREIDDIHVAALLQDMENIEITARVIRKAIDDLDGETRQTEQHTFHGTDLVQSLGPVVAGALPLLLSCRDSMDWQSLDDDVDHAAEMRKMRLLLESLL